MSFINVQTLNLISLITGICAAVLAALAVFLFFHDHIRDLILTGTKYLTKRTEKRLRSEEEEGARTPSGALRTPSGARQHIDQFLKTPSDSLRASPHRKDTPAHHLGRRDEASDADAKTDKLIKAPPSTDETLTTVLTSTERETQLLSEENTDLLKADENTNEEIKEKIEFTTTRKIMLSQGTQEDI